MKIVFVIASLNSGGAERVVSHLANSFSDRGLDTSIVLFTNIIKYDINPSIKIQTLTPNGNKGRYFVNAVKLLRTELTRISPSIVYSFMSETNIITILAGVGKSWKTVVSERQDPNVSPQDKFYRFLRFITYPLASGYAFQTSDAKAYFSHRIQEKSIVIHNPVNDVKAIKNDYSITGLAKICAVGRLTEQKNFEYLIESLAEVKKIYPMISLSIYGEGPLETKLQKLISVLDLDDTVELKGHVPDIPSTIVSYDMFILSSDYEGMSNALMEAMAVGLPCISTDCPIGGSRELICNNLNGILIPIRNKEALIKAMLALLTDYDLRVKLGNNAKSISLTHNMSKITDQWLNYGTTL